MFIAVERPPWFREDAYELARHVPAKAIRLIPSRFNRYDFAQREGGQRSIAKALYEELLSAGIAYDKHEFSVNSDKQRIRDPEAILGPPRTGTCLDLAVLYAGLLLDVELLPVLIILEGHALVAVSTTHFLPGWNAAGRPQAMAFHEPVRAADKNVVLKLIQSGALFAVECTGFAYSDTLSQPRKGYPETEGRERGLMTFERALAAGTEQLQGGRSFHFAIDVATARNKWGKAAYGGPSYSGNDLGGATRNFLEHYVGTKQKKQPFAGRKKELERLQGWLESAEEPPRLIVSGQSGSGKSALLAHWMTRLTTYEKRYRAILLPISVRFGSSNPAAIYEALAVNLAGLQREHFRYQPAMTGRGFIVIRPAGYCATCARPMDAYAL